MKKKLLITTIFLIVAFTGCELLIGTFTANINGTAWESTVFGAVKNGSQYTITGTKNTSTIVITVPGTSTGTYNINPADTTLEALIYTPDYNNATNYYLSTQGSVDLSKVVEGRLSGTFNVWAKNSITNTDSMMITGQFSNILSN
jgi:Family of unknown function (DUF6252)